MKERLMPTWLKRGKDVEERVRRYGGRNIPYGTWATPPLERQD